LVVTALFLVRRIQPRKYKKNVQNSGSEKVNSKRENIKEKCNKYL
jgi:hypothetical protein